MKKKKSLTILISFLIFLLSLSNFPVYAATVKDLSTSANFNVVYTGGDGIAGKIDGNGNLKACDLDGNGIPDILAVAEGANYNSRNNSGSLFVVYDSLYSSYSGTGNSVDISQNANYNLRFDGTETGDNLGHEALGCADIDGNGRDDILIGQYHADPKGLGNEGSLYVIYDSVFSSSSGTGNNFDLLASESWNLRFDGGIAGDHIGEAVITADLNGNNKQDIILLAGGANTNGADSGSVWVIYDSIISNFSGTGNAIDLADTSNWNLRFDGGQAGDSVGSYGFAVADLNNNGNQDLVIGAPKGTDGNVYIVYDSIFAGLTGTGNIMDLSVTTNYNIKFIGPANSRIGRDIAAGDIDSNEKPDILIGNDYADYNSRDNSGSLYVIKDSLLDDFSGTSNSLDLSNSDYYSFRFDGEANSAHLGSGVRVEDINNNNKNDIVIASYGAGDLLNGQIYYIFDQIFDSNTKTYDLNDSSNYNFTYKGPIFGFMGMAGKSSVTDLNQDGKIDTLILLSNSAGDYSTGGAFWIIYNFPHSISIDSISSPSTDSTPTITGSISASNSVTNISMVQYSVDNNSFSGTWNNCTATDGSFNSISENFSCDISALSVGSHTIYFRAYDTDTSYTAQANYASTTFTHESGGGGLPAEAYDKVKGPFSIKINNDSAITGSSEVILSLGSGTNTRRMAISNSADFKQIGQEIYKTNKLWSICNKDTECQEGIHTVYVKFYTRWGQVSKTISDTILYQKDTYNKSLLIKTKDDFKVYCVQKSGVIRHIPSPKVFLSYAYKWEDIIKVSKTELNNYEKNNLIRLKNGTKVYKIENQKKKWIKTAEIFNQLGYNWDDIAEVNYTELNYYPEGIIIN